ncbi:MAG: cytochrome b [Pseudomonadales bacterium]
MSTNGVVNRYPAAIRWLHRIIAVLMIFMIALGWYLSEIDYENPGYNTLRLLHRTIGLSLFPLGLAHLWAYAYLPRPAFSEHLQPWEKTLAKLAHFFLLYVVIAIPVAGYLMSGDQLHILGDIKVPQVWELNKGIRKTLFGVHETLAWTSAFVIGLHVAGALKHHFIDKDDTLRKML